MLRILEVVEWTLHTRTTTVAFGAFGLLYASLTGTLGSSYTVDEPTPVPLNHISESWIRIVDLQSLLRV